MKKIISILLSVLLLASLPLAAFADADGQESISFSMTGLTLTAPSSFKETKGILDIQDWGELMSGSGIRYASIDYVAMAPEAYETFMTSEEVTEEELDAYFNAINPLCEIYSVDGNRDFSAVNAMFNSAYGTIPDAETEEVLNPDYASEIAKVGEYTFFRYQEPGDDYEAGIDAAFKDEYLSVRDTVEELLAHASFYAPQQPYEGLEGSKVAHFETTDIDGNPVSSEELFALHEVTMVNIWASWCGPCIGEMPELAAMNERLAEKDCAIVGILYDGDDPVALETARGILEDAGVTYTVILPPENIDEVFAFDAFPTTFFVDREGNFAAAPVVGAYVESYEPAIAAILGETPAEAEAAVDTEAGAAEAEPTKAAPSTENAEAASNKSIHVTGKAVGLGEADAWINDSTIDLTVDGQGEAFAMEGDVVFHGEDPIHTIVWVDDDGLYFTFPELSDEQYYISRDTMQQLKVSVEAGSDSGISVDAMTASLDPGAVMELMFHAREYLNIISGIRNENNTETGTADYELPGLKETVPCKITTFTPSKEEWSNMLTQLVEKVQNDDAFMRVVESGLKAQYAADSQGYATEEEYVSSVMESFRSALDSMHSSVDSIASMLDGTVFEMAMAEDDDHIVSVKGTNATYGMGLGYETFGTIAEGRRDALVMYTGDTAEVLCLNTAAEDENGISGKLESEALQAVINYAFGKGSPYLEVRGEVGETTGFTLTVTDDAEGILALLAFDSYDETAKTDKAFEIRALIRDTDASVTIPEGEPTELTTEEEIRDTLTALFQDKLPSAA